MHPLKFLLLLLFLPSILNAQNYLQYELGTTSRECGYPGRYTVDMEKIYEVARTKLNPHILLLTPRELTEVQEEIKQLNESSDTVTKHLHPCMTCSQDYEACIVFDELEGSTEAANCGNWTEWRDKWDKKVHESIKQGLSKVFGDPNTYELNYRLRVGPDGKVTILGPPKGYWNPPDPRDNPAWTAQDMQKFRAQGPAELQKLNNFFLAEFGKLRACRFPPGTKLLLVDRNPDVYHNVPGKEGYTPSPIPKEP
jgi:hypothetical protein